MAPDHIRRAREIFSARCALPEVLARTPAYCQFPVPLVSTNRQLAPPSAQHVTKDHTRPGREISSAQCVLPDMPVRIPSMHQSPVQLVSTNPRLATRVVMPAPTVRTRPEPEAQSVNYAPSQEVPARLPTNCQCPVPLGTINLVSPVLPAALVHIPTATEAWPSASVAQQAVPV